MACSQARYHRRWAKKRGEPEPVTSLRTEPVCISINGANGEQIDISGHVAGIDWGRNTAIDATPGQYHSVEAQIRVDTEQIELALQAMVASAEQILARDAMLFGFQLRSPTYDLLPEANACALELIKRIVPAGQVSTARGAAVVLKCYGSHTKDWYRITANQTSPSFSVSNYNTTFCIEPRSSEPIPIFDHALAVWLLITTNEPGFLEIANVIGGGYVPFL